MSTLSTHTLLLPKRGEIGRDYKPGWRQQGFEEEREQTLRFFGVWEHASRQFGDKAPLLLIYFLRDHTIELRQLQQNTVHTHAFSAHITPNDDQSPFPPVIKRMQIPKPNYHSALKPSSGGLRPMRPEEGFYHWQDILVGKPLDLLGKKLLIMEADASTQEFYASQGVPHQLMMPMQMDSLRVPHGPSLNDPDSPYAKMNKNVVKLMQSASIVRSAQNTLEGHSSAPSLLRSKSTKPTEFLNYTGRGTPAMRFKAGLVASPGFNCSAADRERKFVVTFFLEDSTLAIAEPPNKSTRTGGPGFFLRQKTCKPPADNPYNPTVPYTAEDFYVGALVPILLVMRTGYEAEGPKCLQLLEADTWTLDFMESRPQTFPMADYNKVKDKLLEELSQGDRAQHFVRLLEIEDAKSGGNQFAYRKQLHSTLQESGCDVPMHSVITLARRLDNDAAGVSIPVLVDELSLPPFVPAGESNCSTTPATPAHGHMTMTYPPRAKTAAASVRVSKYAHANDNSKWSTLNASDALASHRIGGHLFGPDPWTNPYYNRRELGTHLIKQAMTQKQADLPKWA